MSNVITATAVAIADAINAASVAGSLSQQVTAVRKWLPSVALEELNGIFVLVVAKAVESTIATRSNDWEDIAVDVGYFMKLTANEEETQADALFDLIQQIHGILRTGLTIANASCSWQGRKSEPIFDVTTMEQQRVLRSATTYTYKVYHNVHA